ncbi:hypothetical protein CLOM_g17998 [Closterium sp. NIES-68]|nr:hypothetical protein CLOM_g17998 [Closterium sp. NIES-68]GJP70123.1 hypothetical protein CLOP_g1105 [Closterium sp. NIES-67]
MYEADGMDPISLRVNNGAASANVWPSAAVSSSTSSPASSCDLGDGAWEEEPAWPLYETDACPLARETSKCSKYGRPDKGFAKLRWKLHERVSPSGNGDAEGVSRTGSCSGGIPKVTRANLCERVANRRIAFVGDSLSQNMFESLACMAYAFEGMPIVKLNSLRDRIYYWPKCNFTLGILFHQFLSHVAWNKIHVSDGGTIHVDQPAKGWMDQSANFDTFVINSGLWWTTSQLGFYNITLAPPYTHTDILTAYHAALNSTLSAFREEAFAGKRVIVTTTMPSHKDANQSCPSTLPIHPSNSAGLEDVRARPIQERNVILTEAVQHSIVEQKRRSRKDGSTGTGMQQQQGMVGARISLLDMHNVTLSRQDGHPGRYTPGSHPDCIHYCLPGVPDSWNELLLWRLEAEGG